MGFLATAIAMYFNAFRMNPIFGSPELDWPETVFEALLTSTRPPLLYLTRTNPTVVPIGALICLVVTPMVPSAYMVLYLLAYSSNSPIHSWPVSSPSFLEPPRVPPPCSYIKPYCSRGVVTPLALFSIGLSLQRWNQTLNPVETNKGDIPSERIPDVVSNVEVTSMFAVYHWNFFLPQKLTSTLPTVTLPFLTNSKAISQRTNHNTEEAEYA
ncbi:hypothetical protein EDD85DRAFT_1022021 [Armillaria nabsnona]|nr:hypothetical protein EDD85DRAFT_1022021 [Armillaria nabsnona]